MRPGRLSMPPIAWWPILAGLIGSVALLAFVAQAHAAPKLDYGDAPDGAGAGYEIAVTGKFPSLAASSGPRHKSSGPSLGIRRDTEPDSKQVDRDRYDDGVGLRLSGSCKTSRITVLIDTRRIPRKLLRQNSLFLNAWFDWDRSGTWGETNGCPTVNPALSNEWAIVNQRINGKAFLKERVRAFTFRFAAGFHSYEFWTRTTLTLGQKLPVNATTRTGGVTGAPYAYGETEDMLIRARPAPPPIFPDPSGKGKKKEKEEEEKEKGEKEKGAGGPFKVSCIPNPLFLEHGKAGKVRFALKDEGKGLIFGKQLTPRSGPSYRSRILRHPNQRGVPRGYFRAAGFRVKSTKRDARKNPIEFRVFKFRFQRGKTKQILRCFVVILHERIVEPKKQHKPAPVPPPAPDSQPQPQPQPSPTPGEEEETSVTGKGTYAQVGEPQQYQMEVEFDQAVDGFRIELNTEPPQITQALPVPACQVEDQSVVCTGSIGANTPVPVQVEFNPAPGPGDLDEHLYLYAIQGGTETGPFEMFPAITTF